MYPVTSLFSRLRVAAGLAGAVSDIAGEILNPTGAWRPPEWSAGALTAMTVIDSAPETTSAATDVTGQPLPGAPAYFQTRVLVFDAVLRAEHARALTRTEHPIQAPAGAPAASIADHAFLLPARVTLEIGMSDAMASFADDMWDEDESKSVSAYQTLVDLHEKRALVRLDTRLNSYRNMLVESVATTDTAQTRHGLRATVVFAEVFLAPVTSASSRLVDGDADADQAGGSDRPQTTEQTPAGFVQATPPAASFRRLFQISTAGASLVARIPGAGAWTSLARQQLGALRG